MANQKRCSQLGETGRLPVALYPQDFDVRVNDQAAHLLGIEFREPSGLLESIKAAERKGRNEKLWN
jgi:hypothetical protein